MPFWVVLAVQLLISAALAALSYMLAPKPEVEGARPAGLGDFRVNTATEGRPIPVIWGTVPIDGPNVVWYGNFAKGPFKEKGTVIGFHYKLGIQFALCHGVIDGIRKIRTGKRYVAYNGGLTKADIVVNLPKLYGGDNTGGAGGLQGRFKIYDGAQVAVDSYLASQITAARLPVYKGVSYVVLKHRDAAKNAGAYIGNSSSLHQYEFVTSRFPDQLSLTGSNHICGLGANPAEVLYECLTNTDWGLGFAALDIDVSNFASIGNTLFTEGQSFSMRVDSVRRPLEIIQEVERQINARLYLDLVAGQFKIKLIRADYVIASVPQLSESNVLELKQFSQGEWAQTSNEVRIPFEDESQDYKATYALAQDEANFEIQGRRRTAQVKFPGVTNKTLANQLAWRELRSLSVPLATATVIVNRTFYALIPGEVVAFSWAAYGFVQLPMRVANVDLGSLEDGKIELTLVQDVFANELGAGAAPPATEWVPAVQTVVPFASLDQFAVEVPRHVALSTPGGENVLNQILVGGASSGGNPLRYEMRYALPTTYVSAGFNAGGTAVLGTLRSTLVGFTNAMPAQGAGSIVLDTIGDSEEELLALIGSTYTTAVINAELQGVAVLEPGTALEEWVLFTAVIVNGSGVELTGVYRGAFDTVPRAHASGTRVWIYGEGGIELLPVQFANSASVNVKLLPENDDSVVLEAAAAAMNVAMAAADLYRAGKPLSPIDLKINAVTRPTTANADTAVTGGPGLDFSWTRRSFGTTKPVQSVLGQDDAGATGWSNLADGNVDLQFRLWLYDLQSNPSPASRGDAFLTATSASGASVASLVVLRDAIFDAAKILPTSMRVEVDAIDDRPGAAANNPSRFPLFFDFAATSDLQTTQSVDLDGTSEYLANTAGSTLGVANAWTLESWVKLRSTGTQARHLCTFKPFLTSNSAISLWLPSDAAGAPFRIQLWTSAGTLFKQYEFGSYTANAWTQLAATWNGTTLTVYQDGVDVTAGATKTTDNAGTMTDTVRNVTIGVDDTLLLNLVNGLVHRQSLWNVALGASAVAATYNAGDGSGFEPRKNSGSYTSSANLQHCWDWRESANVGRDYGFAGTLIDVDANASNIAAADLSNDQP